MTKLRNGLRFIAQHSGIRRWQIGVAVLLPLMALVFAAGADAQEINLDLGEGGSLTGRVVQLILLMTVLSLAPSILIMVTSFTRIIVVLSLMRNAMGTQQTPPNVVLTSLALFLTAFIMAPAFETAWENGVSPLIEEEITQEEAFAATTAPFREFMLRQVREKDLLLFLDMSDAEAPATPEATPYRPRTGIYDQRTTACF